MASGYRSRIADGELRACLASAGAVVNEGPKACGKTRLAQQLAASTVLLDVDTAARQALAVDPALVLAGPRPRLLDEWQVEPALWNQVRRAVDAVEAPGQFLHTGSAVPADDAERHTGAGRFSFLRLWTMTLRESGAGQGGVSLAALLAGEPPSCPDPGPPATTWSRCVRWTCNGWMGGGAIPGGWEPCCAPSAATSPPK